MHLVALHRNGSARSRIIVQALTVFTDEMSEGAETTRFQGRSRLLEAPRMVGAGPRV